MDPDPRVEVFGECELLARLQAGEAHYQACISIGNPPSLFWAPGPGEALPGPIKASFDRVLRLSFYDLEEAVALPGRGRLGRLPSLRDARKVMRFYEETKDACDGWTIHCWAGVSRSTAVALAILYRLTCSEEAAARTLRRIRPEAMPNRRLVAAFDEVMGSRLTSVLELVYREARVHEALEPWASPLGQEDLP